MMQLDEAPAAPALPSIHASIMHHSAPVSPWVTPRPPALYSPRPRPYTPRWDKIDRVGSLEQDERRLEKLAKAKAKDQVAKVKAPLFDALHDVRALTHEKNVLQSVVSELRKQTDEKQQAHEAAVGLIKKLEAQVRTHAEASKKAKTQLARVKKEAAEAVADVEVRV